jgi:hypothetical protein
MKGRNCHSKNYLDCEARHDSPERSGSLIAQRYEQGMIEIVPAAMLQMEGKTRYCQSDPMQ